MTIVSDPPARPRLVPPDEPIRLLRRPTGYTKGIWGWITTVDHKKIGIMYGAASLFFFAIGGGEALLIRAQLAAPGQKLLSAALYNQVFTMHGTTMIFLFVMPLSAAFANYMIPIQIGARDVAFPRLNAFGYWHIPILLGVIAAAAGIKKVTGHPGEHLHTAQALELGGGIALFMLGSVLFRRSLAFGAVGWRAAAVALALATIPLGLAVSAAAQLAVLVALIGGALALERRAEGDTVPP